MIPMPTVVTHRYDPARGAFRNLCSLPDRLAEEVLLRLGHESRPNLKPHYLSRRRATERWLSAAAQVLLERIITQPPVYFFLGDFSFFPDPSRPASLVIPLAALPADAITFTLGDSMRAAQEPDRRLYSLPAISQLFSEGGAALSGFGFTDADGPQARFIELQAWGISFANIPGASQLTNGLIDRAGSRAADPGVVALN
jgi:hypothetical protein